MATEKQLIIRETPPPLAITYSNYNKVMELFTAPAEIFIEDHLSGFDQNYNNKFLNHLNNIATAPCVVWNDQFFNSKVTAKYPNLQFKTNFLNWLWKTLNQYNIHPELNYKNFICSFNGSAHVSRKLLVSILQKFGYFNPAYCSKNFSYSTDVLNGHICDYVQDNDNFYRKFFISDDSEDFFQSINTFGHVQYNHKQNIYNLESKLTESFLHIVSETMATSYHPFVTEKFLYSIVTRGLFLAYAQPGWHHHIEKYYGFKLYTKLFDYRFDSIENPVERVVELMCMISKFSRLTTAEWYDLYLIEQDTIEYNYDHYFSGSYLKYLKKYSD
jgi:hypothetical protein